MIEQKEKEKQIIKVEKYPEGLTHEQKMIIDIYIQHQKGLSFTTFQREFFKKTFGNYEKFIETLEDIEKKSNKEDYPIKFCLYKENSEILKFGSQKDKEKSEKMKILLNEVTKND